MDTRRESATEETEPLSKELDGNVSPRIVIDYSEIRSRKKRYRAYVEVYITSYEDLIYNYDWMTLQEVTVPTWQHISEEGRSYYAHMCHPHYVYAGTMLDVELKARRLYLKREMKLLPYKLKSSPSGFAERKTVVDW
jgi:hypothetical protein